MSSDSQWTIELLLGSSQNQVSEICFPLFHANRKTTTINLLVVDLTLTCLGLTSETGQRLPTDSIHNIVFVFAIRIACFREKKRGSPFYSCVTTGTRRFKLFFSKMEKVVCGAFVFRNKVFLKFLLPVEIGTIFYKFLFSETNRGP